MFQVWERRTQLVKNELAAASAATDAKTARLRALRLAKEAEDAEAARIAAKNAPPAPAKKRAQAHAPDPVAMTIQAQCKPAADIEHFVNSWVARHVRVMPRPASLARKWTGLPPA